MKTLGLFLVIAICCSVVETKPRQYERRTETSSKYTRGPLQPKPSVTQRPYPKYVLKIYERANRLAEQGSPSFTFSCIFPKILRTKRALKVIFENDSLKDEQKSKWKGDELRIFMSSAKKSISSSNKPYFVKVFDLFSRRLVNTYKFSSKDEGWKTINITDWRKAKAPKRDRKGRFGIKIVVVLGKKKLSINKTAFRESKKFKYNPYFIEFFNEVEDEKIDIVKPKGLSILDRYKKNNKALPKNDLAKRDYFLPFQLYDVGRD